MSLDALWRRFLGLPGRDPWELAEASSSSTSFCMPMSLPMASSSPSRSDRDRSTSWLWGSMPKLNNVLSAFVARELSVATRAPPGAAFSMPKIANSSSRSTQPGVRAT